MKTIWFRARMWLANRLLDLGASPQFARWVAHLPKRSGRA